MVIVNADDFGRTPEETDAIVRCFEAGRITSTTAMVFMADSERAAALAKEKCLEVGLHLNLSQIYSAARPEADCHVAAHSRIVRFMRSSKYAVLLYHPFLRRAFHEVFAAQLKEFVRLFGKEPSHIDGHQHRHISANVLCDTIIPRGSRVRKNFSFFPGQKGLINRIYRARVDRWMRSKYKLTDYFFSLPNCMKGVVLESVMKLAQKSSVEIMTHPIVPAEFSFLMSDGYARQLRSVTLGGYSRLN
jgi:chitin disaccharide deacetylase